MADEKKKPRSRGKIGRIRIGLNVFVQIVLILFLVAMVNSFAFKHYARWDFSRDQKYTLSDKTKRFLDTLKGKIRITVFFSPNTPISADVQNLLTEYQYAGKGKVDIEHIDPERKIVNGAAISSEKKNNCRIREQLRRPNRRLCRHAISSPPSQNRSAGI